MLPIDRRNRVIGFTASAFDLGPHAGHCAMLAELRQHCDFLVVGLQTDPSRDRPQAKKRPVQSIFERWLQVTSNRHVDLVVPFEDERDLDQLLRTLLPDVRFVGEEYRGTRHTGSGIEGIRIVYNKRRHGFSSLELRRRVARSESENGGERDGSA